MKKWLMTIVTLVVLSAGAGCLEMTTPADVVETQTEMKLLADSVDAYQDIVLVAVDQMKEDKLISMEVVDTIEGINEKVDELQPVVVDAVKAVLEAEYSGDKLVDIVTGAQAVNTATASVNPYAPLIDLLLKLGLGAFGVGATTVAVKKSKNNTVLLEANVKAWDEADAANNEAREYTTKYKAMKQGTERFKLDNPTMAVCLYDAIGNAGMRNGGA